MQCKRYTAIAAKRCKERARGTRHRKKIEKKSDLGPGNRYDARKDFGSL